MLSDWKRIKVHLPVRSHGDHGGTLRLNPSLGGRSDSRKESGKKGG